MMGMYTELHFNVELTRDVPENVIEILKYMIDQVREDPPEFAVGHPLFETPRWHIMLQCDSAYFPAETHSTLHRDEYSKRWILSVRSNLKNYDDEIEQFLDWIDPYVDADSDDFLGFYRYEESQEPVLIRKG